MKKEGGREGFEGWFIKCKKLNSIFMHMTTRQVRTKFNA